MSENNETWQSKIHMKHKKHSKAHKKRGIQTKIWENSHKNHLKTQNSSEMSTEKWQKWVKAIHENSRMRHEEREKEKKKKNKK